MQPHNNAAAPTGIGSGGQVGKAVTANTYPSHPEIATGIEYAAVKLTTRFRLRIETARLVCRLSGLGGAA
jgi:hypothetical protein